MRTKHLIISLAVLMFVSCNQKPKYELSDLSNPLLDEWFANFKAADSTFLVENFYPVFYPEHNADETSIDEWGGESQLYGFAPQPADIIDWNIYSPDSSFYLDLDFYSGVEGMKKGDIWEGGDIDTKTILVDVHNSKALDIICTNCCHCAVDAYWLNDSVFVMLCSDYNFDEEDSYFYISVWDREKIIVNYFYDGKINISAEKFSPFFKRLQRKGLKIKDIEE